jgi:hypothetical protein
MKVYSSEYLRFPFPKLILEILYCSSCSPIISSFLNSREQADASGLLLLFTSIAFSQQLCSSMISSFSSTFSFSGSCDPNNEPCPAGFYPNSGSCTACGEGQSSDGSKLLQLPLGEICRSDRSECPKKDTVVEQSKRCIACATGKYRKEPTGT